MLFYAAAATTASSGYSNANDRRGARDDPIPNTNLKLDLLPDHTSRTVTSGWGIGLLVPDMGAFDKAQASSNSNDSSNRKITTKKESTRDRRTRCVFHFLRKTPHQDSKSQGNEVQ